jgi:hypothetical protein
VRDLAGGLCDEQIVAHGRCDDVIVGRGLALAIGAATFDTRADGVVEIAAGLITSMALPFSSTTPLSPRSGDAGFCGMTSATSGIESTSRPKLWRSTVKTMTGARPPLGILPAGSIATSGKRSLPTA